MLDLFALFAIRRCLILIMLIICVTMIAEVSGSAQSPNGKQYTSTTKDLNERVNIEVDPTSLGLSINISLIEFAERGGDLPVSLRYSSKIWRMKYYTTYINSGDGSVAGYGLFAEWYSGSQAAGWTSSLSVPYVEYTGQNEQFIARFFSSGRDLTNLEDGRAWDYSSQPQIIGGSEPLIYSANRAVLHLPDGSSHEMRQDDLAYFGSVGGTISRMYYSVDGSRIKYDPTTQIVFLPDGARYLLNTPAGAEYVDCNGNTLSYNETTKQWTDTLNRIISDPLTSAGIGDHSWLTPLPQGGNAEYIFRWRYLNQALTDTNQQLHYIGPYWSGYPTFDPVPGSVLFPESSIGGSSGPNGIVLTPRYSPNPPELFNPGVLSEIELPNGQKYRFTYNAYAEIDKVYLPTGGYRRYIYDRVPTSDFDNQSAAYSQANRGVIEARESVTGQPADEILWTFQPGSTAGTPYVTATNPDGTYVRRYHHYRDALNNKFGASPNEVKNGRVYDERHYSAGGQLIRRILTNWSNTGPQQLPFNPQKHDPIGIEYASRDARISRMVEILLDTGGNAKAKSTEYQYDNDLNVTVINRYDYVSVAPSTAQTGDINQISNGALLRTEETTYLVNDSAILQSVRDAYRALHLIALVTRTYVKNGSGAVVAATENMYDEVAYSPLNTTSTPTQWNDPGTTARGTATTVRRWLNIYIDSGGTEQAYAWGSGGQWLATHLQTDICGNPRFMWDARGNASEIRYDDNFSDSINRNTFAYPTQTLTPQPYTGINGAFAVPYGTSMNLTTVAKYHFQTGKPTSTTDANAQTTTFSYSGDSLGRLTTTTRPNGGGETIIQYNDAPGSCACDSSIKTRTLQSAGVYVDNYTFFDGLGRAWRSAHGEGGGVWSVTDTQYDNMGRAWKTSNPMLTSALGGAPTRVSFGLVTSNLTTTGFDSLGRPLTVTTPDGSVATTSYSGNEVTVADQANSTFNPVTGGNRNTTRRSVSDALGRLIQVVEAPGSVGHITNYTYDSLNNLRKVSQGAQERHFLYDSVGRLVRANNLEQVVNSAYDLTDPITLAGNSSWTSKYEYDANGNLARRRDPRGMLTTYDYDNLNRNYKVTYGAVSGVPTTANVERYYDFATTRGKGRPWITFSTQTHPISGAVAHQYREISAYDVNGRPTNGSQLFRKSDYNWMVYPMTRSYDLAGNVTAQTYPSGHTANYMYSASGRLNSFSGNLGDGVTRTYANQMVYNAAGRMTSEWFGTQTPLTHEQSYNLRHQMYGNLLGTSSGLWNRGLLLTYYSRTGRGVPNPGGEYSDNNGNVWMMEHYIPSDAAISTHTFFRDVYDYDDLNRLKQDKGVQKDTAEIYSEPHQQAYNYDQYGNRTFNAGATFGSFVNNLSLTPSTSTNQLTKPSGNTCTGIKSGLCYDLAGNQIFDNYTTAVGVDREFDSEHRMTKAMDSGGTSHYVYDADGKRVRRISASVETWYVYGFDGELIAEYPADGAPATPQKEYGYRAGQMLVVAGCDVARWLVSDHLGTPRIEVDVTGSLANVRRHDYLPFGEELGVGVGTGSLRSTTLGYTADCIRQQFGSKERDNETGLDWFGPGRYSSSIQGRFSSIDPILSTGHPAQPQSWNRYSYVVNNPLRFVDPTGMFVIDPKVDEDARKRIITAYENLKTALGNYKKGSRDYNRIKQSIDYLGAPGVKNGITVTIGETQAKGVGGETALTGAKGPRTSLNPSGLQITITLTEKTASNETSDSVFAAALSHEGVHAALFIQHGAKGGQNLNFAKTWGNAEEWNSEVQAFHGGAAVAQALAPTEAYGFRGRVYVPGQQYGLPGAFHQPLWNPSWASVDQATIENRRYNSIRNILTTPRDEGGYDLKPPK